MTGANFNRALLNATGNGVLAVDPEGVILLSNRVAKEQFGAHPGGRLVEAVPELWPDAEKTAGDRIRRASRTVMSSWPR